MRQRRRDQASPSFLILIKWYVDRIVAKGFGSILLALLVAFVIVLFVETGIRLLVLRQSLSDTAWASILRLIDPSSMQQETTWPARILGVAFVVLGILATSVVVALTVTLIEDILNTVRNGHTRLVKTPDILILGASDQLWPLLNELGEATQSDRRIAVISARTRAELESMVRKQVTARDLKIECRTADPSDPQDLVDLNVADAAKVIILSDPNTRSDSAVVRSLFAILSANPNAPHSSIVAEIDDDSTAAAIAYQFGDSVVPINSTETLALIFAQCLRAPGMSQVLDQLTSYKGGEIYEITIPCEFIDQTYGDVFWRLENVSPIGYVRGGQPHILPPLRTIITEGDRLLVVDQTEHAAMATTADAEPRPHWADIVPQETQWQDQKILVIGWSRLTARSIEHARSFIGAGSVLEVLCDEATLSADERASLENCAAISKVRIVPAEPDLLRAIPDVLAEISPDVVAVVPYREQLRPCDSDAQTLIALASVRKALPDESTRVIAELRESKSAHLATTLRPDDLLLSDAVSAAIIAQQIDRPWLDSVLADLLDYHGSALFMRPVSRQGETYLQVRRDFLTRGELVCGILANDEVILNPDPGQVFAEIDAVVVVGAARHWGHEEELLHHISDILK